MHCYNLSWGLGEFVVREVKKFEIELGERGWEGGEKIAGKVDMAEMTHGLKGIREGGELVIGEIERLEGGHARDLWRDGGEEIVIGYETLHQDVIAETTVELGHGIRRHIDDTSGTRHRLKGDIGHSLKVHLGEIENAQSFGVFNDPRDGARDGGVRVGGFVGVPLRVFTRFFLCLGGLLHPGGLHGLRGGAAAGAIGRGVVAVLDLELVDALACLVGVVLVILGVVDLEDLDLLPAGDCAVVGGEGWGGLGGTREGVLGRGGGQDRGGKLGLVGGRVRCGGELGGGLFVLTVSGTH